MNDECNERWGILRHLYIYTYNIVLLSAFPFADEFEIARFPLVK